MRGVRLELEMMFFYFRINDLEYGRGTGSSKKVAKAEAAKKTLEMLIPEIRDKLPSLSAGDAEGDAPDLSFFDGILVEDSRVADLCNRCGQSEPFLLITDQSEPFILTSDQSEVFSLRID